MDPGTVYTPALGLPLLGRQGEELEEPSTAVHEVGSHASPLLTAQN